MRFWQIEITNKCNFTCSYCPRTELMQRPLGVMSAETIRQVVSVCTSSQIHLHHFGESLMAMNEVLYAVRLFKEKGIVCIVNTNGSLLTPSRARVLFDAGLDKVVLSWHPPEVRVGPSAKNSLSVSGNEPSSLQHVEDLARELPTDQLKRIEITRVCGTAEDEADAKGVFRQLQELGFTCSIKRLRNLGQTLHPPVPDSSSRPKKCSFLDIPEFAVLWDGSVVVCCECYDNRPEWVLGNVFDEEFLKRQVTNPGCSLCKGCPGYGGVEEETERSTFAPPNGDYDESASYHDNTGIC